MGGGDHRRRGGRTPALLFTFRRVVGHLLAARNRRARAFLGGPWAGGAALARAGTGPARRCQRVRRSAGPYHWRRFLLAVAEELQENGRQSRWNDVVVLPIQPAHVAVLNRLRNRFRPLTHERRTVAAVNHERRCLYDSKLCDRQA